MLLVRVFFEQCLKRQLENLNNISKEIRKEIQKYGYLLNVFNVINIKKYRYQHKRHLINY